MYEKPSTQLTWFDTCRWRGKEYDRACLWGGFCEATDSDTGRLRDMAMEAVKRWERS